MKRKHLFLAIAVLLAAGGFWFARSGGRSGHSASDESVTAVEPKDREANAQSGQMLNSTNRGHSHAPPDQTQRFREFTPEQRVEFARKGYGPGG